MTSPKDLTPSSPREDIQVVQALLAEVQEVVHSLTKTLKIFRTYPRDNSTSISAVDELTRTLCTYLGRRQKLELFVERHELQWQGVPVYSERDQRKSFALKLDLNGVRRLVFYNGLGRLEVTGLLEALTAELDEQSLEDDLVTLLWEKQLSHIKVYVLDEMSGGHDGFDASLLPSDDLEGAPEDGVSEGSSQKSSPAPSSDGTRGGEPLLPTICAATKAKLHPLTEEQAGALRETTEKEASHDVSEDFTEILFDILQTEPQEELLGNILKVLIDLVMMYVKGALFARSADILGRLRALAADEETAKDLRARVTEQLQLLADPTCITAILETLQDQAGVSQEELSRFLMMLPAAAASELCALMKCEPYRDTVRSAIMYLAKDDPKVLASKLASMDIQTAENVLTMLEEVAQPELIQAMFRPLTDAEGPVKLASVNLLSRLKGTVARDLLLSYVASGDATLRKAALKALGGFGEFPGPATALRQQVMDRNLHARTLDEKKSLLVTIAKLESRHAVEFLGNLLAARRWFEKRSHAETRACAALALGEIDDDRARDILARHTSDKAETVRTATHLALSRSMKTAAAVGSQT